MSKLTIREAVLSLPLRLHSVCMENLTFSVPFNGSFRNDVCVNYIEPINVGSSVSNTLGMFWKLRAVACLEVMQGL